MNARGKHKDMNLLHWTVLQYLGLAIAVGVPRSPMGFKLLKSTFMKIGHIAEWKHNTHVLLDGWIIGIRKAHFLEVWHEDNNEPPANHLDNASYVPSALIGYVAYSIHLRQTHCSSRSWCWLPRFLAQTTNGGHDLLTSSQFGHLGSSEHFQLSVPLRRNSRA